MTIKSIDIDGLTTTVLYIISAFSSSIINIIIKFVNAFINLIDCAAFIDCDFHSHNSRTCMVGPERVRLAHIISENFQKHFYKKSLTKLVSSIQRSLHIKFLKLS